MVLVPLLRKIARREGEKWKVFERKIKWERSKSRNNFWKVILKVRIKDFANKEVNRFRKKAVCVNESTHELKAKL